MTTYNQLKYPPSSIGNSSIATGAVSPDKLDAISQRMGFKNRIINGDMRIDQRRAGASVNQTDTGIYTLDRWNAYGVANAKFSVQQNAGSVTPPVGYKNYLGCTSLAATSLSAGDLYIVQQNIEGYNVADLAWGTASAKTVTLSFWVRSSLTGTFGGSFTAGNSRNYPFSYTVSAANTWEQKAITVAGDTAGTWGSTNGTGLIVNFSLGTGSSYSNTAGAWTASASYSVPSATSVVGTSGATFYLTGVQLEVGSSATSFDTRAYGTELALCQRYCYQQSMYIAYENIVLATAYSTGTALYGTLRYPVTMRSAPTFSYSSSSDFVIRGNGVDVTPTVIYGESISPSSVQLNFIRTGSSFTGTSCYWYAFPNVAVASQYLRFSAEL